MATTDQPQTWAGSSARWADALAGKRSDRLMLAGYGVVLRVERDGLTAQEGRSYRGQEPQTHRLERGVHGVKEIVVMAPAGTLSLDALRWCREQRIRLTVLDQGGSLVATVAEDAYPRSSVRRAQYLAALDGTDIRLARWLIEGKCVASANTLRLAGNVLPAAEETADILSRYAHSIATMDGVDTVARVREVEGLAAKAYWGAWTGLELPFRGQAPDHWASYSKRGSPLQPNGNARHAVHPLNAVLNYAYALLEADCHYALVEQGFDTSCGFLHADHDGHEPLVYDLMELHRAIIDRLVLKFVVKTPLSRADFTLLKSGELRLHPVLASVVARDCREQVREIQGSVQELLRRLGPKAN